MHFAPHQRSTLARVFTRTVLPALTLLTAFTMGCGKAPPEEWVPTDADNVKKVIAEISDARQKPEKLAEIFVAGKVPDAKWLKASQGLSFEVDPQRVSVSGDSATVKMAIENHFGDPQGEVTWTCKKNGDRWQVEDAPLK